MNTEAVYSVSISGDEALVAKVQELLDGLKLSLRDQPIALKRVASEGETPVIRIYIGNNLSCKELREALKVHTVEYGYLINIIPEDETAESRRCTKTALLQAARFYNYYTRESTLANLSSLIVEHDVLNSLYLVTAPEQGAEKQFILKRFLDASVFLDEFSLSFAREGCLKRHTLEESGRNLYEVFPVSFTSVPIPRATFDHLRALNKIQNNLWMKISSDTDFLLEQTKELEKDDEFVRHFTDILRKVKDSKIAQRVKLSMTRNDFIIDKSGNPLQVELNMYASSLGPISQRHSRALFNIGQQLHDVTAHDLEYYQTGNNEEWLARSMEAAWRWYGKNDAIVVLVVPKEKNALDQFAPATILAQKGIPLFRYSFDEMEKLLQVDEATGVATILDKEVALFYFRDGYMPHHYNAQRWPVREKIELSSAIKCPDVAQVLVNMKYFQYIINKEETWTRFGFTPEQFQACRKHYCDIYTFWDFDSDKQKMKDFIEANGGVKNWVMKPQREGGANNVFGDDISKLMESSSNDELHAYILMKLIDASTRTGIQCTWAHMQARAVIDEMGMFYSVFQEGDKVLQEVEGGTLVRSKVSGTNEGGVAFGFSVINSVKLKV